MKQCLQCGESQQECGTEKTCFFQSFGHELDPPEKFGLLKRTLISSAARDCTKHKNIFCLSMTIKFLQSSVSLVLKSLLLRLLATQKIVTFH